MPLKIYTLQEFVCQSGLTVPELRLAYRSYGELNAQRDNVIVLPTYYTGTDLSYLPWVGSGKVLDTDKYFVVVPNLFGNGVSSSPSNMPPPFNGVEFPKLTLYDNVFAQSQLLNYLGVTKIELVLGWSMGAAQSYQWCAQYPNLIKRALIICGSAKTALHNQVFLAGVKSCIEADAEFANGKYVNQPIAGLKSFARVYAGWAYSQSFFRNQRFREMGFESAEDLLIAWEQDHLEWDANDLLAMLDTWMTADISNQNAFNGDLSMALQAITAKVFLMPCEQDLYFRHEDNRLELKNLRAGEHRGFESDFGHCAPGPGRFSAESKLVEETILELLTVDV